MRLSILILSVCFLISCSGDNEEDELVCTYEYVYGINVNLIDSLTGEPVSVCEVTYSISDGEYVEEYEFAEEVYCEKQTSIAGAGERSGVYRVEIIKSGYEPWISEGIIVNGGQCHVSAVTVNAFIVSQN